jgi:stage III sporulation protein AE
MIGKREDAFMDVSEVGESFWQEYGLDKVEAELGELFPDFNFSLQGLLGKVMEGDILGALKELLGGIFPNMYSQFAGMRNVLLWLVVLGIVSALVTHFVDVFDKHQVSDLSFYFIYLLISAVLLLCFGQAASIASAAVENIILFIQLLVPTFLIAVGVSGGTVTVAATYQLMLLLIYGVENILIGVVLPLIYSYVMLAVINGVWMEEKLKLLMDLLAKGIRGILKGALGLVTGVSIFQAVITPVVDSVKASALHKAISVIPGIGNAAEGVAQLVVGSAVVIKNSIGVVLLLLMVVVCAAPLLEIFMTGCLLKVAAAFMGIVSDKRITNCTDRVGEGGMLLLRTVGTAMLLFMITISVVAMATNRGF